MWGTSQVKSTLAFVYNLKGDVSPGYQISDEAVQLAEESGDILSKGLAYTSRGMSCYAKGYFEDAVKNLLTGNDFCEKATQFTWVALAQLWWGMTCFDVGEYEESIDHHLKSAWTVEHNKQLPSFMNINKMGAARAQVMKGDKDVDIKSLFDYLSQNKLKAYDGWMRRYIGEILLNIDDQHMPEAKRWIQEAIEADNQNDMMFHLGQDYALYAQLFKRKSDQSKVRENLGKAIEILKECGADGWVEKYEKELAALS